MLPYNERKQKWKTKRILLKQMNRCREWKNKKVNKMNTLNKQSKANGGAGSVTVMWKHANVEIKKKKKNLPQTVTDTYAPAQKEFFGSLEIHIWIFFLPKYYSI